MADILSNLLAFPPDKPVPSKEYDKQANAYINNLKGVNESTWSKPVDKQNILALLNPATNSLAYLYALSAQWKAAGKDQARHEDALTRSTIFFSSFDPIQIRYGGDRWQMLLEIAFEVYPRLGVTDLTPISTAMLRLDPTAGTFTSNHVRLVRLSLENGVPSQALPILDKNIYAFPQQPRKKLPDDFLCDETELSSSFINPKNGFSLYPIKSEYILEYYLLGAHVYLGRRNYARARLFLEYILLTPSLGGSCSALQLEAYKKWKLLGLLAQGLSYPLPRTHSQQVMKSLRACAKAYDALADAFEKRQWKKFQAEVDTGMQIWRDDGNFGLVSEVHSALMRFRVLDLQKTYAVLPVSRVAGHLGLSAEQTLSLLSTMQEQGHLSATITSSTSNDPADTILHFHDAAPASNDLESQTKRIQDLVAFTRDADRRLQLSKEYVEVTKRSKRGGAGPDGDLADQMDLTWDPPISGFGEGGDEDDDGDEDIMGS